MKSTMMNYQLTLEHLLERAGHVFPRSEIVSRLPDKTLHRYTYADFYRRSRALAEALQKAGIRRGDRVGTLMWNHYAHMEAYFGIPISGGVLHTLNLRLSPANLTYIILHARDRFLIVDDILLPLYEMIKHEIKIEKVIVVPLTGQPLPRNVINYEEFLGEATGDFQYLGLNEYEPMSMCYTSGTTGRPKGVVYSHRAIVLHSLAMCMPITINLTHKDTLVPVVPMFHVNAWGLPYACAMLGTKLVFPGPNLDPVSLLDLFEEEQVTVTAGVPTIWYGILQALEKNPKRWKLTPGMSMIVGGAAISEGMIRAFEKHDLHILHAWGMTETSPLGTSSVLKGSMQALSDDEKFAYLAKQGLQAPFVEIRAVNENGEVPWDGQSMGELQVRGPWVADSYYDSEENVENWTQDCWLRTGDIVTIDGEGYMKIVDRSKDLIKSGGEWISSVDLENALMEHPAVAEAAVIAVPHPKWSERPLALVVLKPNCDVSREELIGFIEPHFAKFWLPEDVIKVDALPKASTGKIAKSVLRGQYKNHPLPETN